MIAYRILVGKSEWRDCSEDLDMDERIISEWILRKWLGRCGLDASGSG
jgi:hypothetical protein